MDALKEMERIVAAIEPSERMPIPADLVHRAFPGERYEPFDRLVGWLHSFKAGSWRVWHLKDDHYAVEWFPPMPKGYFSPVRH